MGIEASPSMGLCGCVLEGEGDPREVRAARLGDEDGVVIGWDALLPAAPDGYWDGHPEERLVHQLLMTACFLFLESIASGLVGKRDVFTLRPEELRGVFLEAVLPDALGKQMLAAEDAEFLTSLSSEAWTDFGEVFSFFTNRTVELAEGMCQDTGTDEAVSASSCRERAHTKVVTGNA